MTIPYYHVLTLCEICANACGGCCWSQYKVQRPVPNWDAVRQEGDAGWTVLDCPEFVLETAHREYYRQFLEDRKHIRHTKSIPSQRPSISWRTNRALKRLYKQGMDDRQIAKETGIKISIVLRWRLTHGYPCNSKTNLERLRLYHQGMTDGEIARECGVNRNTINAWRRHVGLPLHTKKGGKNAVSAKT